MSHTLVDALANASRSNLDRRQYNGIPSAITATSDAELRSIVEAIRENLERLQVEMDLQLLQSITITDLTKLTASAEGDPIIDSDQATDLARQKNIASAPLRQ